MTCTNKVHYPPHLDGPELGDPHLHCAGRIVVRDGQTVVVDVTPCVRPCRFCGAPAVARYAMDAGCVCYPDDREQDLCAQHVVRATPRGSMELLTTYTREAPR